MTSVNRLKMRAVGFVEDDEVEETWAELRVAERHRLLGGDEEAFGFVDLMRVDPVARLVRQVRLEAIGQGLIDQGVTVREEENVLRLIGAEKDVDQGHGDARLARAGGHDEECAALVGGEGLGDAANGLVLVGAVDDGAVDGGRFERSSVLAEELQPLQVGGREEPGDEARISEADLPEPDVMAVGHEPEGSEGLLLGDLGDVVPELFVGLARVAGASLGFHDGEHVAACVVQAIVGDAVPWLRVIAINWNLQPDLGAVVEFPVSSPQLRVDLQGTGLGFVESHRIRNTLYENSLRLPDTMDSDRKLMILLCRGGRLLSTLPRRSASGQARATDLGGSMCEVCMARGAQPVPLVAIDNLCLAALLGRECPPLSRKAMTPTKSGEPGRGVGGVFCGIR